MQKGARNVYAAAAHAVLCDPAPTVLADSPIKQVVVTDSIPLSDKARSLGDRLNVLTVSELLGEAVRRIHMNLSVSALFTDQEGGRDEDGDGES